MSNCIYFRAIVYSKNHAMMSRLRCKRWSCDYCAAINRKYWRKRLYNFINSNDPIQWSFHTFTLPAHYRKLPRRTAINFIKRQWQKLLQALNRLYGKFEYVRVVEFHRDGTPHIHLLAGFNIPDIDLSKSNNRDRQYIKKLKHKYAIVDKNGHKRTYKAILSRLGFGYITNSQNAMGIPSKTVAYITKYVTKVELDDEKAANLEGLKLLLVSRGIGKEKPNSDVNDWQYRRHLDYADYYENPVILDLNRKIETTKDSLDESWHYPHDSEYLD